MAASSGLPSRALLLERETHLDVLRKVVAEAAAGQARLVMVEGAGGIGKTRLLTEAGALAAEAGLGVLKARGGELEREFAFGIVRQLFEPLVATGGRSRFTGAAAAARGVFDPSAAAAGERPGDMSFAVLHGLYWLTVNLTADGPLTICVDDLHWADRASLRFLAFLVHRLEGLPLLVVGALRPSQVADLPALDEVRADPLTVRIQPGPLSIDATARLVEQRLGAPADEAFSVACHTATAGNPLLLHELLTTLAAESVAGDAAHVAEVAHLGAAASRAVLARLARLSPGAAEIARAVAVLGDDAELSTVAALAEVDIEQAAAAVTELIRAEVFDSGPSAAFVHPLVGEAVYRDLSGADRALRHERAARLLADGGGDPERIAAHLLPSPARAEQRVVAALVTAARSSVRRGAPESAVAYLKRALREPPPPVGRADVLLQLGRAETLTYDLSAVDHLTQAHELLEDPGSRAAAAHTLSRLLLRTGEPRAARVARAAAAELPLDLDDARRQLEALEVMALLVLGGTADRDVLQRLELHRRTPVGPGLGAKMLATMAAHAWMLSGGTSDDCAQLALEALAGGEMIAAGSGPLTATPIEILALADRPEAITASRRALDHVRRSGSLFDLTSAGLWGSHVLYRRGELVEAEELLHSTYEEAGMSRIDGPGKSYCDAVLSAVLRERGKLADARRVLARSDDRGDDGEATRFWMYSNLELLVAEDRMRETVAASEAFRTRFRGARDAVGTPWRSPTALALHRIERESEAVAVAHEDLDLAQRWGAPGAVARALRTLGIVQGRSGIDMLAEAVRISAGTPARLEHAKSLAAHGAALRRSGRRADARDPLRKALELAEVLGAKGLAGHVRSELYAAGARPRTTALSGVAALTPSERRVAALAVAGNTNREIAQHLFVTPKTVEMHLSRAYHKLGIGSRRELAAHTAELDGGDDAGQPPSPGSAETRS